MAAPLVVVILVAVSDAQGATTQPMTAAAEAALGPDAIVVVREVESLPDDAGALSVADALRAQAIAELSWRDAGAVAHVHVHTAEGWEDRDLAFVSADAVGERGRTIGFAVASMIPAPKSIEALPAPPPAPPSPVASTTSKPADAIPVVAPSNHGGALDLLAIGAVGLGGDAGGFGADAIGRWRLSSFAPLVDLGLRRGDVPSAGVTSTIVRVGAGVAFEAIRSRWFGAGLRVEALALYHSVADGEARGGRWLPGADATVEASVWVFPSVAVIGAVGGEFAFGTTHVVVDGVDAGLIPRARLIGGIGLRARL